MEPLVEVGLCDPESNSDPPKRNEDVLKAKRARGPQRLLLIDESLMRRECLEYMLCSRARDFSVTSVARIQDAPTEQPDLVMLDLRRANMRGAGLHEQMAEVRMKFGELPIVAVSDLEDIGVVVSAIREGLRGFIPTTLAIKTAVAALRLVLAGGTYVPKELIDVCASQNADPEDGQVEPSSSEDMGLTHRENAVLEQLQKGKPNKIIAYALSISESTVKVHMRNIMRKLHATNRTQVAFLTREPVGQHLSKSGT